MNRRLGLIAAFLFGSGFSALVYQTVWQKLFLFVFGATSDASAAVLGIFLGGLGLGSAVLGKKAETHERPLLLYGTLELGIALWAALSPLFIDGATYVYSLTGGSQTLGRPLAIILRLSLSAAAIGPAAFLMGGTLPAAARAAVESDDVHRTGLAKIYALNTLGAVFGALCGPLFLFGAFGIQKSLLAAVTLNLTVAFAARRWGKKAGKIASSRAGSRNRREEEALPQQLLYALAGIVGFAFLFMELVWFRMLAPILGGSSVTFGLILAVALAGIGTGGWLFSIARQGEAQPRLSPAVLIATLTWEALFLLLPFAWGDDLALLAAHLRNMEAYGFPAIVGGWLVITMLVVFPAAVTSGYQFPVLFALLGAGREKVAEHVGRAYAFNTLGTISGSLVGGFVVLPWLGAVNSWRLSAALLLGTALVLVLVFRGKLRGGKRWLPLSGAWLLSAALLFSDGPGRIWRHTPIGAGRVRLGKGTPNELKAALNEKRRAIYWERDGREVAVAVSISDGISFLVNGKSDGAVVGDRGCQIMLALIPAALHPKPQRAFVVGLGTGTTAGLLGLVPSIKHVDVAELEPTIVDVARLSRLATGDALNNPKVEVLDGDAREVMLSRGQKYDLIVSEPSNPYRMGIANLFAREFYELTAAKLTKDGLFAQWIQGYEIDAETLSTAIRTLKSEFAHVSIWNSQGSDLILIASQAPQTINLSGLAARLEREPYRTWFPRSRFVEGAAAFASQQLVPASKVHLLTDAVAGQENTDDLNYLEHALSRSVGSDTDLKEQLHSVIVEHSLEPETNPPIGSEALGRHRARLNPTIRWVASEATLGTILGCSGDFEDAAKYLTPGAEAHDVVEAWVLGMNAARHGDEASTLAHLEQLKSRHFNVEAELLGAKLAHSKKDFRKASELLKKSYSILRSEALPLCSAPETALSLALEIAAADPSLAAGLFDALNEGPFAIFASEARRRLTLIRLSTGAAPGAQLDPKRCARAYEHLEPFPIWEQEHLERRFACYDASSSPMKFDAARDLRLFLEREPERYSKRAAR